MDVNRPDHRLYTELIHIYGNYAQNTKDQLRALKLNIDNAIDWPYQRATGSRANLLNKLNQLKTHIQDTYKNDHDTYSNDSFSKIDEFVLVLEGFTHPDLEEDTVGFPHQPGLYPDLERAEPIEQPSCPNIALWASINHLRGILIADHIGNHIVQ
jgi:hypothetical protein